MEKPVIAVDIDEVLAQHNAGLARWHNQVFGANHTSETYFTDYWADVWSVSLEASRVRAQQFHDSRAHRALEPVAGAREALAKLSEIYDLEIITVHRQCIVDDTHEWINEHFPGVFNRIHFLHFWDAGETRTKAQLCKEIGARILIDDSIKHCLQAAELGIHPILFGDHSWNQPVVPLPPTITRVADWDEVTFLLKNPDQ